MPDPKGYKDKQEFMSDCMHQLRKVENKPQDQSVAICLSMWKNRGKKKKSSVGEKIKKFAYMIKIAIPHFLVDLFFEKLIPEDIPKVIKDILNGETIKVPVDLNSNLYTSFSLGDLDEISRKRAEQYFRTLLLSKNYLEVIRKYKEGKIDKVFYYDDKNKTYRRVKVEKDMKEEMEEKEYVRF